jgi:hypothetical protein
VLGKICLNITISNYNYPVTCTVVKTLSNPLILGWMGFIKNNNGIINAKDGIFTLNKPTSQLSSFAFIEELLILQPLTENLVTVQLHETTSSDLTFVNKYEPLFKKAGVTIMPGIHEGKKDNNYCNQRKLKMIITNLSSKPVELPKYTIVASISSVNHSEKNTVLNNESDNLNQVSSNCNGNILPQPDTPVTVEKTSISDIMNLKNSNLTDTQIEIVNEFLKRHKKLFESGTKRKIASNIFHEIDTGNEKPIHNAPNRIAFREREYIQQQIKEMEENNIISPSSSPWSSHIVLVKKKDGKLRFCIDYRGLNAITKKDVYPLPRIDDSLAMLSKGKFFTTLDLWAGYWQIPLNSESKEKTALATDSGLYEFNVMPFGLSNHLQRSKGLWMQH